MYRRPKFLEILLEIRREMALEADYDVDLFAERVRAGMTPADDAAAADVADVEAAVAPSTNGDTPAAKNRTQSSRRTEVKIGSK